MILLVFKLLALFALIQVLYNTENPFMCSGIYASIILVFSLLFGDGFLGAIFVTGISFALASLYFWLLNEFKDGTLHWGIMVGGLLIGLV